MTPRIPDMAAGVLTSVSTLFLIIAGLHYAKRQPGQVPALLVVLGVAGLYLSYLYYA